MKALALMFGFISLSLTPALARGDAPVGTPPGKVEGEFARKKAPPFAGFVIQAAPAAGGEAELRLLGGKSVCRFSLQSYSAAEKKLRFQGSKIECEGQPAHTVVGHLSLEAKSEPGVIRLLEERGGARLELEVESVKAEPAKAGPPKAAPVK